ncbi:MAG: hypothetical protein IPK60_08090 [Sandaracinaceae bacterium]|nr:hypothetical protein [Sandaracinaceae bacterium]
MTKQIAALFFCTAAAVTTAFGCSSGPRSQTDAEVLDAGERDSGVLDASFADVPAELDASPTADAGPSFDLGPLIDAAPGCPATLHMCGAECVSNADVDHCGTSCSPCASPEHGEATCNSVTCGFTCGAGYERCGTACCLSWTNETIDGLGDVGLFSSLAVAADGAVHVSYYDNTNQNLKYAVRRDGTWHTYVVAAAGEAGRYTSIGVGADNTVHISYRDDTAAAIRYAVGTDAAWTLENVETVGDPLQSSLRVDSTNHPHIAYSRVVSGDSEVRLAARTTSWSSVVVADDSMYHEVAPSLALNGSDVPTVLYVSYHDYGDGSSSSDVKAAHLSGDTFDISLIEEVFGEASSITSLNYDSLGHLHAAYGHPGFQYLHYAGQSGGGWSVSEVAGDFSSAGTFHSASGDSDGHPSVVWNNRTTGAVMYSTMSGPSWTSASVYAPPAGGTAYVRIAFDSTDHVHIIFYESDSHSLRYLTR